MESKAQLLQTLNACLSKFHAEEVRTITDLYEHFPSKPESKLGSGSYGDVFRMRLKCSARDRSDHTCDGSKCSGKSAAGRVDRSATASNHSAKAEAVAGNVSHEGDAQREAQPCTPGPLQVVKVIAKKRITNTLSQVQHLAAELAVTGLIPHEHLNNRVALFHSDSDIFLVLQLCEGAVPDLQTRIAHIFAQQRPKRIPEIEGIVTRWTKSAREAQTSQAGKLAAQTVEKVGCSPERRSLDKLNLSEGHDTAASKPKPNDKAGAVNVDQHVKDTQKFEQLLRECKAPGEVPVGCDLFGFIVAMKKIPDGMARVILKQALLGLQCLHSNKVVHRDVKTENFVVAIDRRAEVIREPVVELSVATAPTNATASTSVGGKDACVANTPSSSTEAQAPSKSHTATKKKGKVVGVRVTETIACRLIDFGLVKYMRLERLAGSSPSTAASSMVTSTANSTAPSAMVSGIQTSTSASELRGARSGGHDGRGAVANTTSESNKTAVMRRSLPVRVKPRLPPRANRTGKQSAPATPAAIGSERATRAQGHQDPHNATRADVLAQVFGAPPALSSDGSSRRSCDESEDRCLDKMAGGAETGAGVGGRPPRYPATVLALSSTSSSSGRKSHQEVAATAAATAAGALENTDRESGDRGHNSALRTAFGQEMPGVRAVEAVKNGSHAASVDGGGGDLAEEHSSLTCEFSEPSVGGSRTRTSSSGAGTNTTSQKSTSQITTSTSSEKTSVVERGPASASPQVPQKQTFPVPNVFSPGVYVRAVEPSPGAPDSYAQPGLPHEGDNKTSRAEPCICATDNGELNVSPAASAASTPPPLLQSTALSVTACRASGGGETAPHRKDCPRAQAQAQWHRAPPMLSPQTPPFDTSVDPTVLMRELGHFPDTTNVQKTEEPRKTDESAKALTLDSVTDDGGRVISHDQRAGPLKTQALREVTGGRGTMDQNAGLLQQGEGPDAADADGLSGNDQLSQTLRPEDIFDDDTEHVAETDGEVRKKNVDSANVRLSPGDGKRTPIAHDVSSGRQTSGTVSPQPPKVTHEIPLSVTPCGTDVYCALEVLDGIVASRKAGPSESQRWVSSRSQLPKMDIYGAGAMLYCMVHGRPPFRLPKDSYRVQTQDDRLKQIQRLVAAGPKFSDEVSAETVEFLKLLMHRDPAARPTAAEALAHPYFNDVSDTFAYEMSCDGTMTTVQAGVDRRNAGASPADAIRSNNSTATTATATTAITAPTAMTVEATFANASTPCVQRETSSATSVSHVTPPTANGDGERPAPGLSFCGDVTGRRMVTGEHGAAGSGSSEREEDTMLAMAVRATEDGGDFGGKDTTASR